MRLYKLIFFLLVPVISFGTHVALSNPLVIGGAAAAGGALLINPIGGLIKSAYTGNCKLQQLNFRGSQDPDDNEFLYESKSQFDLAQQGYTNSGKQNSGSGQGWECDKKACQNGQLIQMPAGHVFNGQVINQVKTYKCDTAVVSLNFKGDQWVETTAPIDVTTTNGDDGNHMNTVSPYLQALSN